MKRALEIPLSAALGAASAPLVLAAACLVRRDGGDVLFRQQRRGQHGRSFAIYKLRTMRDGRVTRVGAFLRASGIDELPQLWNVLRGEMALVGPRPLTEDDIRRIGWTGRRHAVRWSVPPGITGPAQLHGGVCDARVSWLYDRAYVRGRSTRRDLAILATSAACLGLGKGRVRRWLRLQRKAGRFQ